MKTKTLKATKDKMQDDPAAPSKKGDPTGTWVKEGSTIAVSMAVCSPAQPWLPVTSKKTGQKVFLPLPIRLIHTLPDQEGGGCTIMGAFGDLSTAKESALEILGMLNGYPLGNVSEWRLATGASPNSKSPPISVRPAVRVGARMGHASTSSPSGLRRRTAA